VAHRGRAGGGGLVGWIRPPPARARNVMALVVQKYGGTSVGDASRIRRVAERVGASRHAGDDVVVVVSAIGGSTAGRIALAVSHAPPWRERRRGGRLRHGGLHRRPDRPGQEGLARPAAA